ncbi:MAG: hypothetical protein J5709_08320 [Bacteroidales bacterium]|nr:hypothetical protein [Bacteroidales bacterium]
MKKTLVFLASALFVALFAASCNSKSTSSETNGIDELIEDAVVEEEPVEDKALTDGMWVNDDWGSKTTYQFKEDGSFRHIRKGNDPDFDTDETGEYTIDGENMKLVVKGDNWTTTSNMTFKIKGNTLTITEAGFPMEYKWQKAE